MRSRLDHARAMIRLAGLGDLDQRAEMVGRSLKELLAIAGSADRAESSTDDAAVESGVARVEASLGSGPLVSALAELAGTHYVPAATSGAIERAVQLCQWTDWLVDLASDRERLLRRRLLQAAAAVAVVLLAYAVFSDRNIARGKTVTASSIGGFTPEALPRKGRLSRMVDGNVLERWRVGMMTDHGVYAGGTDRQIHPWITVDLGRTRTVNNVVVYNRADCCWGAADIPLSLQLSNDNQTFDTVATRETEFSDDFPWRQSVGGRKARYVRLWSPANTPKEIILSEIEVYGR